MRQFALNALALGLFCGVAAYPQVTFTFTSFDPPGSHETHAYAVNDSGTVVGYYLNSSNLYVGYTRTKAGKFSKPISMPGISLYTTGINNSNVLSGYYYPTNGVETSFTYSAGTFTNFSYNGFQTQVDRINNNGDLTGIYVATPTSDPGFLYNATTNSTVTFSVPGAAATFGEGLNKKDVVVGSYTNTIPYGTFQSFIRNANGKINTFAFPGATQTYAEQINDCSVIVGGFADSSNLEHGFYGKINAFTQIDYPGAVQTIVDGINNRGELVGSYLDAGGIRHGFIATPASPSCSL